MKTPKKPYTPTKRCPHRWCGPVHTMYVAIGFMMIGPTVFHAGPVYLILAALTVLLAVQAMRIAWKGKTPLDVAAEDAVARSSGGEGNMSTRFLVVRLVWARIAIGMDMAVAGAGASGVWKSYRNTADYSVPSSLGPVLLGVALTFGLMWFWEFAHRKATEPAKPVRLLATDPQAIS
ncbi:hypothetical protein ACWERV_23090 [Streptomyces sp. NPDC004031]